MAAGGGDETFMRQCSTSSATASGMFAGMLQ
jgi:hypothetical protein